MRPPSTQMPKLIVIALILALDSAAAQQQDPRANHRPPAMPYIDVGACPDGEACLGYGRTRALARMTAYAGSVERPPSQPPPWPPLPPERAFTVERGEVITALTGVAITIKPRVVRFTRRFETESWFHSLPGEAARPLVFEPGDVVYLLTKQGELFYTAWFKGQLYESIKMTNVCPDAANCVGELVEEGVHEWWVYIRNARGAYGWIKNPSYERTRGGD